MFATVAHIHFTFFKLIFNNYALILAVASLSLSKAIGPDDVPNPIWKIFAQEARTSNTSCGYF